MIYCSWISDWTDRIGTMVHQSNINLMLPTKNHANLTTVFTFISNRSMSRSINLTLPTAQANVVFFSLTSHAVLSYNAYACQLHYSKMEKLGKQHLRRQGSFKNNYTRSSNYEIMEISARFCVFIYLTVTYLSQILQIIRI